MANRVKVVCKEVRHREVLGERIFSTYTSGEVGPTLYKPSHVLHEYTFSGDGGCEAKIETKEDFEIEIQLGKEYYIDFCKVIAPRSLISEGEPKTRKKIVNDDRGLPMEMVVPIMDDEAEILRRGGDPDF